MKTLRKNVFEYEDKNELKFCRKSYWKKQPFIFTVYLMNHVFQTSVLPDSKETELGSSNQEVSPSAGKNSGIGPT